MPHYRATRAFILNQDSSPYPPRVRVPYPADVFCQGTLDDVNINGTIYPGLHITDFSRALAAGWLEPVPAIPESQEMSVTVGEIRPGLEDLLRRLSRANLVMSAQRSWTLSQSESRRSSWIHSPHHVFHCADDPGHNSGRHVLTHLIDLRRVPIRVPRFGWAAHISNPEDGNEQAKFWTITLAKYKETIRLRRGFLQQASHERREHLEDLVRLARRGASGRPWYERLDDSV